MTWREGTNGDVISRFAALRARPAQRDYQRAAASAEEWCLIEWPEGEPDLTKYFLSIPSGTTSRRALVAATKFRWRIERDYQDPKKEFGVGQYKRGRWRGFHHHATLCIAAFGFPRVTDPLCVDPLRTQPRRSHQGISPTRRLSTSRIRRSDVRVTCRSRSHPLGLPSLVSCPVAYAANATHGAAICEAARLKVHVYRDVFLDRPCDRHGRDGEILQANARSVEEGNLLCRSSAGMVASNNFSDLDEIVLSK